LQFVEPKTYNVTFTESSLIVECERYYEKKQGSCETAAYSFDTTDNQYPFSELYDAYEKEGMASLNRECERICGAMNNCRAYSVSGDVEKLQNIAHCNIYTTCIEVGGTTELYVREPPFNCFVKATTWDGVFQNYNDRVNPFSQLSRLLEVQLKPFMDVHLTVNGVVDSETYAIRPYKEVPEGCTSEDELDCLFFQMGWLGAVLFVGFAALLSVNVIVLVSKKNLV
jgi:hypothetical protein